MMAMLDIGKHCSYSNCGQTDFLPLVCECNSVFCKEHFNLHCLDCPKRVKQQVPEFNDKKTQDIVYICSKENCKSSSIIPLFCLKCNRHFCVEHRHINRCEDIDVNELQAAIEKVQQPRKEFNEAKAIVDQQVKASLHNAKRKDTAAKVQLMRLKSKATGLKTIPTDDRLYFAIYESENKPTSKPIFVSRDWTLGRVIDAVAAECKVRNENNKASGPKLRLFRKADNQILSEVLSVKIQLLIDENVIINGEDLILSYLPHS